MRASLTTTGVGVALLALAGCSTPRISAYPPAPPARPRPQSPVVQAGFTAPNQGPGGALPAPKAVGEGPPATDPLGLPELTGLTLQHNPRLGQVTWAVETARGRAIQAGLYPNPTVSVTGDELGDRTGPAGIWTAPMVSQEIVTADKLGLNRAAAFKEVDQATLALVAERFRVLTEVRQAYFEVLVLERRAEILTALTRLADQSVEYSEKLLKAKEASRLDVVQLEVDRDRYRAEAEATERALPAAYRRLAASVGVPDLPAAHLVGELDAPPPDYDLERLRAYVVGVHPELRSAQLGVERAQLLVRRAEVEPIPNLTVSTGYTRQNQNQSNDWTVGLSMPVPVWNRNQGNVFAAKAQLGEAIAGVGRVQNDLVGRLAASFGTYAAARQRAERYKADILPKTRETYELALKAYQGGQFEYLRVIQAQRSVAEANLEYVRSLGEMWRAASEVAGMMLEDQWPLPPRPVAPAPERKQP